MSEKLLPIVPGCMALTHNCQIPENNGKIVIVKKFLGHVSGWKRNPRWDTDTFGETILGAIDSSFAESQLLRIDGGDFKHEKDLYELPRSIKA